MPENREPLLGTRNQTWWYRLWRNLSCCSDGVQAPRNEEPSTTTAQCQCRCDHAAPPPPPPPSPASPPRSLPPPQPQPPSRRRKLLLSKSAYARRQAILKAGREQQNNGNVPLDRSEVRERDEGVVRTPAAAALMQVFGPMHPRYSSPAARLFTFKDWPRSKRQKPEELVEAGFFYLGEEDKTKCFFCDGGLKDWEEDDIPWEQHARWFDRCAYVQSVKGRDYIQNVISQVCVIPARKEQKEAVLDSAHAPKPSSSTEKKKGMRGRRFKTL